MKSVEDIILVISEDNPADWCSRHPSEDLDALWMHCLGDHTPNGKHAPCKMAKLRRDLESRLVNMEQCVEARSHGWNWASCQRSAWVLSEAPPDLRHVEGERLDSVLEDDSVLFPESPSMYE